MKLYSVRNWPELYETHETKKLKRLSWVPVCNRHDGRGFKRLMRRDDGAAIFGAFILIVEVASRMKRRGVLQDDRGAWTPDDLSDATGAPADLYATTLAVLSSAEDNINWLLVTELADNLPKSPGTSGNGGGISRTKGREGKGKKEGDVPPTPQIQLPEPTDGDTYAPDDPATKPAAVSLDLQAIVTLTNQLHSQAHGGMTDFQCRQCVVDLIPFFDAGRISEAIGKLPKGCKPWELADLLNGRPKSNRPPPGSEAAKYTAESEARRDADKCAARNREPPPPPHPLWLKLQSLMAGGLKQVTALDGGHVWILPRRLDGAAVYLHCWIADASEKSGKRMATKIVKPDELAQGKDLL